MPGSVYVYVIQQYVFITWVGTAPSLMQLIGSPTIEATLEFMFRDLVQPINTNQVVGGDNDAADEQQRARDAVVASEDHVVDDSLVDKIADLDEARHGGHHPENGHFGFCGFLFASRSQLGASREFCGFEKNVSRLIE